MVHHDQYITDDHDELLVDHHDQRHVDKTADWDIEHLHNIHHPHHPHSHSHHPVSYEVRETEVHGVGHHQRRDHEVDWPSVDETEVDHHVLSPESYHSEYYEVPTTTTETEFYEPSESDHHFREAERHYVEAERHYRSTEDLHHGYETVEG